MGAKGSAKVSLLSLLRPSVRSFVLSFFGRRGVDKDEEVAHSELGFSGFLDCLMVS